MPSAIASAKPEPKTKTPEPPPVTRRRHNVALTLKPGDPPCTFVIEGDAFEDHTEWFTITSVTRIETEESGGCAAAVVYDLATEKKPDPTWMDPEALRAGMFQKPGQKMPAEMANESTWNHVQDLDFDDVADLCVVTMTGAYNYGQNCWLFDTKSRTFIRHRELDDLIFLEIDRKAKKLKNAYRAGGPVYENNEYVWQKGVLVKTYQATSYFGEKPDASPLPNGFSHWLVRRELRNGKLVKTFEGPTGHAQ